MGSAVAVVDERAARALWGTDDPVGRMLSLGDPAAGGAWVRVIGVARDAELGFRADPYLEPEPAIYLPRVAGPGGQLVARVAPGAEQRAAIALRRAASLDPGMCSTAVLPWLARFDAVVVSHHFVSGLFVLFGLVALALATVGLYSVLSYTVSRRTREFGVRLALGARRQDVLVQVLREGMVLVLGGVAAGALLSLWTSQLMEAWMYDLPATDVAALAAAEAALALVALLASLAPAMRASRANPVDVLRAA
jgi:putative ABC transport system permease protein